MPIIGLILVIAVPAGGVHLHGLHAGDASRPRRHGLSSRFTDYWRAIAGLRCWRIMLADLLLTLGPGTTGPLYVYFFHDAKGFTIPDVSFLLIFYIGAGIAGAPFWARARAPVRQAPHGADRLRVLRDHPDPS